MWPGLFNSNDGDLDVVRDLQQPASEGQHSVGAWDLYVREASSYSPLDGPTHEADYYSPKMAEPQRSRSEPGERNHAYIFEKPAITDEKDMQERPLSGETRGLSSSPDESPREKHRSLSPVRRFIAKRSLSPKPGTKEASVLGTSTSMIDVSNLNGGNIATRFEANASHKHAISWMGNEETANDAPAKTHKQARSWFQASPPDATLKATSSWGTMYNTAPPSTATAVGAPGGGQAILNGSSVIKPPCLSFSDIEVEGEDLDMDDPLGGLSAESFGSMLGGMRNSARMTRESLDRRLKKRMKAWRRFQAVMQDHGLRVRKHHRRGRGWAHRVVKYDPALPGLRWKSSKWWDSSGGEVPLRDVLDVERRFKTVWIKCLHLGTVGFEATLEDDAVIFYLAMDSLLSKRCGVIEGEVCIPGPLVC
ncbi:unnamed protein product [Sphacelaria rigidula]